MLTKADELLKGAIDIHAHTYPEYTFKIPPRVSDIEWAQGAKEVGMRGFVLKSHLWPTAAQAYLVQQVVPGIGVYGTATLNPTVGGLNPFAAELAGELGCKILYMPTWSSRNDLEKSHIFYDRLTKIFPSLANTYPTHEHGLCAVDGNGKLLAHVKDIVRIAGERGMALASGHLSPKESVALAEEAARVGTRFILSHPLSKSVNASIEEQKHIAGLGGFIEHVYITCMPMHQRLDPRRILECIQAVGPEHCIIASDAIRAWNPTPWELMRMFIDTLLELNLDERSVRMMCQENPAKALGLPVLCD